MNDKRPPDLLYPNLSEERRKQRDALEESLRQSGCVADANEGQAKCKKDELLAADKGEASHTDQSVDGWEENVEYLLNSYGGSIRVREGGGPEDLIASLCVTFIKLRNLASHSQTSATAKTLVPAITEAMIEAANSAWLDGYAPNRQGTEEALRRALAAAAPSEGKDDAAHS